MSVEIIAAIIGFFGAVIAAVIGRIKFNKYQQQINSLEENSFIRFMRPGENFNNLLNRVDEICMYTVNSFEILNVLNLVLEQNTNISIKKLIIFVRKKIDENENDLAILENNINRWKYLVDNGKIKHLEIISYDHDPDHYYTIIGDRLVFFGQILFDNKKPTGTTINYSPLVVTDDNTVGQQIIKNYQNHFDNAVKKYKHTSLQFNSSY